MIRGYYSAAGGRRRPYVKAFLRFPSIRHGGLEVELLVDTGADRTILAPLDALRLSRRFRVDLTTLPAGTRSTGIGGTTPTRVVEAALNLETVALPLTLTILEPTVPLSRPFPRSWVGTSSPTSRSFSKSVLPGCSCWSRLRLMRSISPSLA